MDLAAQVEDRQAGHRAEAEQDAPNGVVLECPRPAAATANSGPTMSPAACIENTSPTIRPRLLRARVLAHDRGGDRVVAADADAEDAPEDDQPGDVRGERRRDRAGREDQDLKSVDPLAPEHVGDPPEHERSDR